MLTNNKPPKSPILVTYKGRYGFWRLINIVIFGLLISGAMFTYHFIYQNIYSTIANANAITSLQANVNIYDLDLQAYEKATLAIAQKKRIEEIPSNIRNIFYYGTNTSTFLNSSTRP